MFLFVSWSHELCTTNPSSHAAVIVGHFPSSKNDWLSMLLLQKGGLSLQYENLPFPRSQACRLICLGRHIASTLPWITSLPLPLQSRGCSCTFLSQHYTLARNVSLMLHKQALPCTAYLDEPLSTQRHETLQKMTNNSTAKGITQVRQALLLPETALVQSQPVPALPRPRWPTPQLTQTTITQPIPHPSHLSNTLSPNLV